MENSFYTAEAQGPYETASIRRLELEEGGRDRRLLAGLRHRR